MVTKDPLQVSELDVVVVVVVVVSIVFFDDATILQEYYRFQNLVFFCNLFLTYFFKIMKNLHSLSLSLSSLSLRILRQKIKMFSLSRIKNAPKNHD